MQKDYESIYHAAEENYWWFHGRREFIISTIQKQGVSKGSVILEVGCSGGRLLELLNEEGFRNLSGIDLSEDAICRCRERNLKNVLVKDGENTGFEDGKFDLIIASDILEHIKNEEEALLEWYRILRPGGKLILFVPAFNFLWSSYDEFNFHYRRYTKSYFLKKIVKAGFKVELTSYWNFILFLPIALVRIGTRLLNTRSRPDRIFEINRYVNRLLLYLIRFENWLLGLIRLPIGVSLFAVVKKQS
ncbi:MAG TPA: class I SAM-dependent methyltransferase [Bacteroidales bacterium]|nr:class I SAM-dependent methyltransferase [Bacteroidales bacterium]